VLRNELLLSKDNLNNMSRRIAAESGKVELLEKLWDWAKNCS